MTSCVYIINHPYHLESIKNIIKPQDGLVVISDREVNYDAGDDVKIYSFNLFEPLPIHKKLFYRCLLWFYFLNLLRQFDEVVMFGLQDKVSYQIYKISQCFFSFKKLTILPDNFEFYARYMNFNSRLSLGLVLKSILYGHFFDLFLFKNLGYRLGRFFYYIDLDKVDIAKPRFLYGLKFRERTNISTFVSQPYYLDYNICVDTWCKCLAHVLEVNDCSTILVHPRDSQEYIDIMLAYGFTLGDGEIQYSKYYCLFSTYIATLQYNLLPVNNIFSDMAHLLPNEYVEFVYALTIILHKKHIIDGTVMDLKL